MHDTRLHSKITRTSGGLSAKRIMFFLLLGIIALHYSFGLGSVEESSFTYPVKVNYISPENQDGVQDKIDFSFQGNISPGKKRKIEKVTFNLYDDKGNIILSNEEEYKDDATYSFTGKDESNNFLPDGSYVYTISSLDDKGNVSTSQPYPLVIDNTAPEVQTVKLPKGVLASFKGGISLTLEVYATKEVSWKYIAVDASNKEYTIFSQQVEKPSYPPKTWDWNAVTDKNELIPDGFYNIIVEGLDLAGNSTRYTVATKVSVSQDGAVRIKLADESNLFSPNEDGVRDDLHVDITIPSNGSISVEDYNIWKFLIKDAQGEDYGEYNIAQFEEQLLYPGKISDGSFLNDGEYTLTLAFQKGENFYFSNTIPIVVDTTYPLASVFLNTAPEASDDGSLLYYGGDTKDKIVGYFKALEDLDWNFAIFKEVQGNRQKIYDEPVDLDEEKLYKIEIDKFYAPDNMQLTDGFYTMDFYAEDMAGNRGGAIDIGFVKDTREKFVSVATDKDAVSPFALPLNFIIDYESNSIQKFNINIKNVGGREIISETVSNRGLSNFEWDAKDVRGQAVDDGDYIYTVSINYYNGTKKSTEGRLVVDSVPPKLDTFALNSNTINPKNKDSKSGRLEVEQSSEDSDANWKVEIRNIFEQTVYSKEFGPVLSSVTWDGQDKDGNIVPDGDYLYILVGNDLAGNTLQKDVAFIVDTGQYTQGKLLTLDGELPKIYFPAYSQDIFSYGEDALLYENLLNIRSVARLLKSNSDYKLKIIGHAAALLKGTPREAREQTEVLMPLSQARAEQIRRAMVILGIDEDSLSVTAVGGIQPIIENPTKENIWQNRRVEFQLSLK